MKHLWPCEHTCWFAGDDAPGQRDQVLAAVEVQLHLTAAVFLLEVTSAQGQQVLVDADHNMTSQTGLLGALDERQAKDGSEQPAVAETGHVVTYRGSDQVDERLRGGDGREENGRG